MARKARRGKSRGGVPWLWILILLALAAGVAAARTLDLRRAPSAEPTPHEATAVPVAAARALPTSAPTATVGLARAVAPTPRATATPALHLTATSRPAAAATTAPTRTAAAAQPTPATIAAPPTNITAATVAPTATAEPAVMHGAAGAVALTFDAGADRGYAQDILDVLAAQHVPASFGITGNWARANADLVRRMAADGHMVFNHTLDHRSFTGLSDQLGGLSAARRRDELEQADAIIAPLIGHSTRPWYRLPYGDDDARIASDVASIGYDQKIGWTVDSLGWRGASVQDIIARCVQKAAPHAIYVLHVGRDSRDGPALPSVIDGLRERGFSFARVDEL